MEFEQEEFIIPNLANTSQLLRKFEESLQQQSIQLEPAFENGILDQSRLIAVKQTAREKKEAREKTAKNWFDMPQTEITPSVKKDLQLIQARDVLDPKRFYKKQKKMPKYFQMGILQGDEGVKQVKPKSLIEALLQDTEQRQYLKKKFTQIQMRKQSGKRHFKKKS